jgi:amino acid adenylation domain-containing protein
MSRETTTSFARLLWDRAQWTPDRIGYTFLSEPKGALSYGALHERAAAIAARLLAVAAPGDRAVLLIPPGPDYVAGFFGCLYAGIIAVPAYPPLDERQVPRLLSVIDNARPALVLTDAMLAAPTRELLPRREVSAGLRVLALDDADGPPPLRVPPDTGRDDVAFLQYTSGSAGEPKGVVVSHGNLLDNSEAIRVLFGHDEHSQGVIWLPPYHDMGLIGGILQPLYAGFPVALMSPLDFLARPASWLAAVGEHRATTSGGPNFAFDLCVAKATEEQCAGLDLSSWTLAFCGAEPVRAASLKRFADRFAPYGFSAGALFPCYGLAESTLIATGGRRGAGVAARDGVVSCGAAIPGHRLTVRAPGRADPLADGEIGEVCVSGPSVSRGYWDSPRESGETFTRDGDGAHTLRTGDLGFLRDGELYVTGRAKDLIIVRGRNLAAVDVEFAAAGAHPLIRPGCVAAFGADGAEGEVLVVLAELRGYTDVPAAEIRAAIQTALAAHFGVTAGRILLARRGTVLKTPSGKIRRAECRGRYLAGELASIGDEDAQGGADTRARAGAAELAALAATVLGMPPESIGTDTGLTGAGMDSLRAVELLHAAHERLGLDLSLAALLGGAGPNELVGFAGTASKTVPDDAGSNEAVTDGETALWATSRLSGDPAHYVLTIAAELRSTQDTDVVETELVLGALRLLCDRHAALRTYFPEVDGRPVRTPCDDLPEPHVVDLPDETAVAGWIDEFESKGVDPSRAAPWKAALLRPHGGRPLLVLCAHHMVCDLWSLDILKREFVEAFSALRRGGKPHWAPAADPGHLAARRIARLAGPDGERLEAFWRTELRDAPPAGALPSARHKRNGRAPAARIHTHLPPELAERIRACARHEQVTTYTVLFTAFAWLLHHYTGERRFVLGVPAPGRLDPESATAVGYFVNPLPLICEIDPAQDFAAHLRRTRDRIAAAMAHQDYPYQRMLEHCGPRRAEPALRVLFLQQQTPAPSPSARHEAVFVPRLVRQRNVPFELTIEISAAGEGLACSFSYDADALRPAEVKATAAHWRRLLEQATAAPAIRPGSVCVLGREERRLVLEEWNAPDIAASGPATVHEAVLAAAARRGSAPAVRDEAGTLTYAELDRRSARLAALFAAHGAGPQAPVGLALPRSTALVAAMLGAMRAGAAYVPLDVAHPAARLAMISEDAAPSVILTRRGHRDAVTAPPGTAVLLEDDPSEDGFDDTPPPPAAPTHPDWPAYIMYTSGSTGRPKGVVCGHRGVLNLLADSRITRAIRPDDRCGWWTSPGFDVSVYEVFGALTVGAAVEVCPPAARQDAGAFMDWAAAAGVTVAYVPPHLLADLPAWLAAHPGRSTLRHLTVSVEPIPEPLLREIMRLAPGLAVTNGYGPTEATVFSSLHPVDPDGDHDGVTPMGRGVRNCPHYLLDSWFRPVPPGAPGEVYIGGSGLAHGYLRGGAQTAQRFVPSPFRAGERLYRTGDLARYRPDGQLIFLGRTDDQVKVRGMRIEPREVEAAMTAHPRVATALVLAHDAVDGRRLVGYAQVADPEADSALAAELSALLRDRLPGPMVPRHIVLVADWPMTVNGKIDRARLPRPHEAGRAYTAPVGALETTVAQVWAELLGCARVGRDDDFFDLGGDSLLATRCAVRLGEALGLPVDAVDLLDHPVLGRLAAELAGRSAAAAADGATGIDRALLDHVSALPADAWELLGTRSGGPQR